MNQKQLEWKCNCLANDIIRILGNTCVLPITQGCRAMTHFFLSKTSFNEIGADLQQFFKEENIFVQFGSIYVYDGDTNFLIYQDQNVWDAYCIAWLDWKNGEISSKECCKIHGEIFGYSEEAINKYLTNDSTFPADTTTGNIVLLGNFLTYSPGKFVPTFELKK